MDNGRTKPNRVRTAIAGRPPHTTEHAGLHSAVQAGWKARAISLKAGLLTRRRRAVARGGPGFGEAGPPPPCPPWSGLHSAPFAWIPELPVPRPAAAPRASAPQG